MKERLQLAMRNVRRGPHGNDAPAAFAHPRRPARPARLNQLRKFPMPTGRTAFAFLLLTLLAIPSC